MSAWRGYPNSGWYEKKDNQPNPTPEEVLASFLVSITSVSVAGVLAPKLLAYVAAHKLALSVTALFNIAKTYIEKGEKNAGQVAGETIRDSAIVDGLLEIIKRFSE